MIRRKRPRRQRKSTRAELGRKADKLWSLIVRSRGRCEACGGGDGPGRFVLQGAHGFSRRYRGTRWLPINGFCLCSGCHVSFTHDPLAWDGWLRNVWGESVYSELRAKAQATCKPDFGQIIPALESEARSRGIIP